MHECCRIRGDSMQCISTRTDQQKLCWNCLLVSIPASGSIPRPARPMERFRHRGGKKTLQTPAFQNGIALRLKKKIPNVPQAQHWFMLFFDRCSCCETL